MPGGWGWTALLVVSGVAIALLAVLVCFVLAHIWRTDRRRYEEMVATDGRGYRPHELMAARMAEDY